MESEDVRLFEVRLPVVVDEERGLVLVVDLERATHWVHLTDCAGGTVWASDLQEADL